MTVTTNDKNNDRQPSWIAPMSETERNRESQYAELAGEDSVPPEAK